MSTFGAAATSSMETIAKPGIFICKNQMLHCNQYMLLQFKYISNSVSKIELTKCDIFLILIQNKFLARDLLSYFVTLSFTVGHFIMFISSIVFMSDNLRYIPTSLSVIEKQTLLFMLIFCRMNC